MAGKGWAPFTFPFVITTWGLMSFANFFSLVEKNVIASSTALLPDFFSATTMGFGQVMFQGSIVTGVIFFFAILINSRLSAFYALGGSILGALIAFMLKVPFDAINIGLFGFNAVLCAIAFSNSQRDAFLSGALSSSMSSVIMWGFMYFGLVSLTAPFVFATWITSYIKSKFS